MSKVNRMQTGRAARAVAVAAAIGVGLSAQPAAAAEPVVEKLEHGQIDWSAKTVIVTGSGAPKLDLENVAQVRLAAERAAKLDAYRKIVESLKGVRITATELGSAQMSKIQVRTQVQGIIRGCKTVDTRYYSDGGVDVVLQCPLDGGLAAALAPIDKRKKVSTDGEAKYSGLIVDATGLGAKPALSPRILDEEGGELYGAAMVNPGPMRQRGAAGFSRSVDAAKEDVRVGKNPLVIKASAVGEADTDIKVSAADAEKLKTGNLSFLAEGRVVIATDAL